MIQSDGHNPQRMMKLKTLKFGGTGLLKICGRTFKRNLEARERSGNGHYDDDDDEYFSEDGLETDLFI